MRNTCLALAAFVLLAANPSLQAQVSVSNEDIPYGMNDMNCSLTLMRASHIGNVTYPNGGKDSWGNPTYSSTIGKVNQTVFGAGLEVRLGLLYLFLSQDKHRFRIADSEIVGFVFGGNKEKRFDYATGQKIGLPGGLYSPNVIGGSYVFAAGLRAVYRISNALDVGACYYPFYFNIDIGATINGNTTGAYLQGFGGHLRAGKVYLDILQIKLPSKITDRPDHGATYIGTCKYLYNEKWRFLSFSMLYQQSKTNVEGTDKGQYPQKWWVCQVGWGMMF